MKRLDTAEDIDNLLERLFWINRSLSGVGNRETLKIISEYLPIQNREYPSGSRVYDWEVPAEWSVNQAWIRDSRGKEIVNFRQNPLHLVGYSESVRTQLPFSELESYVHTLPDSPEAIPYRTTYYKRNWGFCVTLEQYELLKRSEGLLDVLVDTEFNARGSMTTGELHIPSDRETEYLISTYICHPAMANDNLSGIITAIILAQDILCRERPGLGWRFAFVPETIGAIAYLSTHSHELEKLKGGFVLSCCGGRGSLGVKKSFRGNCLTDRAVAIAFRDRGIAPKEYAFTPQGSDERQYSSPGFRIPITTICKDKYHEYAEYHTSLDNLDFVNGDQILEAVGIYRDSIRILEGNTSFISLVPNGEPQLGRRGLYPATGGANKQPANPIAGSSRTEVRVELLSWALFFADGVTDLISVSEKSGLPFVELLRAYEVLEQQKMVKRKT